MVAVHACFRREYGLAPDLVRAVAPGDVTRAGRVGEYIDFLNAMLRVHHDTEDRLLWPLLHERVPDELSGTVDLMRHQHKWMHEGIEECAVAMARWRADAAADDREQLADALDRLHAIIAEHLTEEEQHVLPLATRCLTQQEWARLSAESMSKLRWRHLVLFLGMAVYQLLPVVAARALAVAR